MALRTTESRNGHKRRSRPGRAPMSEINVTPFVDVMLVLLIIFMVAAPLLTSGVKIDLPQSSAGSIDMPKSPLTVSVKADGSIFVKEQETEPTRFIELVKKITDNNTKTRIFLRADKNSKYESVIKVIGALAEAGYNKVALVSELVKN